MITTIHLEVKNKLIDFRNLERLVQTPKFREALALDPDNVCIKFAIASGNVDEVKAWIEEVLVPEIGEMSMRQLRARAAKLDIPRYTSYTKDELIVRIIREQDARKAQEVSG